MIRLLIFRRIRTSPIDKVSMVFNSFSLNKCFPTHRLVNTMKILAISWLALASLVNVGCLEDRKEAPSVSRDLPSSWFQGVSSVQNMGGFPVSVQVKWPPSDQAKSYRVYMATTNSTSDRKWTLISEISDPLQSSYVHRDSSLLSPGAMYTYMVKAIDSTDQEDANEVQKSNIAFEGINRVTVTSKTSVQISINTSGSFSKLKAVAHPARLATTDVSQDVVRTIDNNQSTVEIDQLKSGTTYSFNVQVLVGNDGASDGNAVTLSAQTPSESFGSGAATESQKNYQYRNFRLIQGFGLAPHEINTVTLPSAPTEMTSLANPHVRMVKLIPNPFSGSHSGKFRIVRVSGVGLTGNDAPSLVDMTSTEICTDTSDKSCVVCDHSTNKNISAGECDMTINDVPPTFIDKSVAAPPKKYFYALTYVNVYGSLLWPDELPQNSTKDFLVAAHIPDSYMVLVQRDSVNYEMCVLMGQISDPRKFNRCTYSGIAAAPYNTKGIASNLDDGYFDFGYNLLADRHALSCNWSRPKPATAPGSQPCSSAYGCMGLSVGATNAGFPSESTVNSAPNALPTVTLTPNTTYAGSPLAYFNIQHRGNNCYAAYLSTAALSAGGDPAASAGSMSASWVPVGALADIGVGLSGTAAPITKNQITSIVSQIATPDPGPLGTGNYSDRKRPTISGLSNVQAQSLCNSQSSSAYGTKRLMRRREYIAASPLSSLPGEPGFSTVQRKNTILNGSDGQTLYNWQSSATPLFGNGSNAGLGSNPGGCSNSGSVAAVSSNPLFCLTANCGLNYNNTVPRMSNNYCSTPGGCTLTTNSISGFSPTATDSDGATLSFPDDFLTTYMDPRNESTYISANGTNTVGNSYSNRFFSGSLATNKCVSRFGMQDPYPSTGMNVGSGISTNYSTAMGIIFSDKFRQTSTAAKTTNPPVFVPISNNLDFGVYYDYTYNQGSSAIEFSNASTGYSATGYNGSHNLSCTDATTGVVGISFTNNFFYLTNLLTVLTDTTSCASNASGSLASLIKQPQRNQSTFSGYLPILGIPLTSYASGLNVAQSQVDYASFLYSNQFARTPSSLQSYGRFYSISTNGTTTVNMSSGVGGRWSYELSESGTLNNGGSAWCAVEAE